ncbi:MAG: hypothetical protein ACXW1F_07530 [Halobacteriota archaeon]
MYCFDVKTIVLVGMIMIWLFVSLMFLLDRKLYDKAKWIHYVSLAALIFWCLFALIVGGLVERMYAVFSLVGMTAVQALVRRRRKLEQRLPDEQP